jgi:methylamine dehydrogenase heavy chain
MRRGRRSSVHLSRDRLFIEPGGIRHAQRGLNDMTMTLSRATLLACAPIFLSATVAAGIVRAAEFPTPLPTDQTLRVEKLPAKYPTGWAFLNYASDRIELRNVGADTREVKAQLQARDSSALLVSDKRPEVYIADTVWSRGVRGTRTDFITIYDSTSLNVAGEIVLPGAKRALITAMEGLFAFTDDQRMALVFNFTPASSVTVVDLVKRQPVADIDIPGCSLVYPSGSRGFSTLCSSGTILSIRLDANGQVAARSESKQFNPLDTDPLFTASAMLNGIRYFPSLHGRIQPIDMKAEAAKVLPDWSLVSPAEKAANWRPSGWQILASDEKSLLYVLMQPNAEEGTHKNPATEVWVFNPATKTRVKRMRLVRPGSSIALTHGPEALMLVQAGERLDVYDSESGTLVRSLDLPGFRTRMQMETLH